MKEQQFTQMLIKMLKCNNCLDMKKKNGSDCSLINIYKNQGLCKNIPSIWTDWYNRLNSDIMIVGQDWGPYQDMEKFYNMYRSNPTKDNWNDIIEQEKSLTKKMLTKYIVDSARSYNISLDSTFLKKLFITNAIMCARKGGNYRADNINLKKCTLNCVSYLKSQIGIVQPKIILTLGYYPLYSLSKLFDFALEDNLTSTIEKRRLFRLNGVIIIPLYHPSAQISRERQLEQYNLIWQHYCNEGIYVNQ